MKCKRVSGLVVSIGVFAIVFVLSVLLLKAQADHSRRQEAHEHGVAHLNVAVEGADLYLEFISPAANIVGFEHPPRTDAQKIAVKKAVETLKDGEALIVLPAGAQCRLAEPIVDNDIDSDKTHAEDDEHQRHSEFKAEYHFACKHPEKLAHVDVMLLRGFPGIERIEVQLLAGIKQTALELTAKKNRIPF
jgi:hypothetical protein